MPAAERSRAYERLVRKLTTEILWVYVAKVILSSGPLKAYEVRKRIVETFGIKPRVITTYTVVYRMAREGLLASTKIDGDVVYSLTEKGRREFEEAAKFLEALLKALRA